MKVGSQSNISRRPFLGIGIATFLSFVVSANGYEDAESVHRLRTDGTIGPLEYFITDALLKHPGRVIDAKLHHEDLNAHYIYEILLLDRHGQVRELEYDANTGALMEDLRDWD